MGLRRRRELREKMKLAIEPTSRKTKRLLFIDANPLIALYENNKNSEKAKI